MKTLSSFVVAAAFAATLSPAIAEEAAADHGKAAAAVAPGGKPEKVAVCAACHGEVGVSTAPLFPNLAGQHRSYIEVALHAYKSGARKNAVMAGQAVGLSDADIKALAVWYSSQKPVLYTVSPEGGAKATAAK
ncbi:cytochrome c [Nevskia sp.]|uniref:c-type cytochrome n=1 Tax=Nevskia sp. TaxID=1929292 RepID=UPI0025F58D3F|nr:cytochrome c [Nevskia sp.]